jgi:hypothetical protein
MVGDFGASFLIGDGTLGAISAGVAAATSRSTGGIDMVVWPFN